MKDQISKFGIGTRHVRTKGGMVLLKRWGLWTPLFSIMLCQVSTLHQAFHNHEASFVSFIVKGSYTQLQQHDDGTVTSKKVKWFNYVPHTIFHTVRAEGPAWSIHLMGPYRKSMIMLKVKDRLINSTRIVQTNR